MTITVNTHEAKSQLSKLLAAAERGEDVVIARAGKPVVRLVLVNGAGPKKRVPGSARGEFIMSPDFDDPLPPEILALFYESPIEPSSVQSTES